MAREILAGAGALDLNVALTARDHGLAGLEFLSGIPGTIGGAIAMNGGAYGGELAHVLVSAEAVDRRGVVHHVAAADLGFSYRHSAAPADWVFTSARLRATPGDQLVIARRIAEIDAALGRLRAAVSPLKLRVLPVARRGWVSGSIRQPSMPGPESAPAFIG